MCALKVMYALYEVAGVLLGRQIKGFKTPAFLQFLLTFLQFRS